MKITVDNLGRRAAIARLIRTEEGPQAAIVQYKKVLAMANKLDNHIFRVDAMSVLGDLYMELGAHDTAHKWYKNLLGLHINKKPQFRRGICNAYCKLGNVCIVQGEVEAGNQLYERAMDWHGGRSSKQLIHERWAASHKARGDYAVAEEHYRQSVNNAKSPFEQASALVKLGDFYTEWKQQEEALAAYDKALAYFKDRELENAINFVQAKIEELEE